MSKVNYLGFEMSSNLKTIIEHSLTDGKISDSEKKVIYARAEKEGISCEEIDILLDSAVHSIKSRKNREQKQKLWTWFITKPSKEGIAPAVWVPILLVFVIFFGSIIIIKSSDSDKASDVSKAITEYNFIEARNLLAEIGEITKDDYNKLLLQIYNGEIDYYLQNKEYNFAHASTNELYTLCVSATFYDMSSEKGTWDDKHRAYSQSEVIQIYYYPKMLNLINSLVANNKRDIAKRYVKDISNDDIRIKIQKSMQE